MGFQTIQVQARSETAPLRALLLGTACNWVNLRDRDEAFMARFSHDGASEIEAAQARELDGFEALLRDQGIEVFRPEFVPNLCQIFARDLGAVIGDRLLLGRSHGERLCREIEAILPVLTRIDPAKILRLPEGATLEGGDVLLWRERIFLGLGDRTNGAAFRFIRQSFPDREVIPFRTVVSRDPYAHVVHLDCTFQPVGEDHALIHEAGFVERPDALHDLFGSRMIPIDRQEFYDLGTNVLSLAPGRLVSEPGQRRINTELRRLGFDILEVTFKQVARSAGSFRCATLPLVREEG